MMNENIEPDVNGDTLPGVLVDENSGLTLAEISRACAVHAEMVMEMVAEGLLMPEGNEPQFWRFIACICGAPTRRCVCSMTWALTLPEPLWRYSCWMSWKYSGHAIHWKTMTSKSDF